MRQILLLITVLLSTVCGPLSLLAQTTLSLDGFQSDPEASIEMLADRLTVSQTDGAARFEGNVVERFGILGTCNLKAGSHQVDHMPPLPGDGARFRL